MSNFILLHLGSPHAGISLQTVLLHWPSCASMNICHPVGPLSSPINWPRYDRGIPELERRPLLSTSKLIISDAEGDPIHLILLQCSVFAQSSVSVIVMNHPLRGPPDPSPQPSPSSAARPHSNRNLAIGYPHRERGGEGAGNQDVDRDVISVT